VGLAGNRVIVADGAAGVAVIDISDPPEAAIQYQLEFGAETQGNCVAVQAGIAYVGFTNGLILAIDPPTGAILDVLEIHGAVADLFFEGTALRADRTGHPRPRVSDGRPALLGSADSPANGPI
jgi:hypothetical protein